MRCFWRREDTPNDDEGDSLWADLEVDVERMDVDILADMDGDMEDADASSAGGCC